MDQPAAETDRTVRGLGSFRIVDKKARQRFNPNTKKYELAPARKVVKYVPAKSLVEKLNA